MTKNTFKYQGTIIRRIAVMILLFAFYAGTVYAQPPTQARRDAGSTSNPSSSQNQGGQIMDDPNNPAGDTLNAREAGKREKVSYKDWEHNPNKAMAYALVLPGLGQAYNKKYWKMPFVYAAFAGAGYFVYYSTGWYRHYSDEYVNNQESNTERYLKYWRRNVEISYLSVVVVYALQTLDAYVDAHLFYWDVDPDLTVRLEPSIKPLLVPGGLPASQFGLSCKLTF